MVRVTDELAERVAEIRRLVAEADATAKTYYTPPEGPSDPYDREEKRYLAMNSAAARAGTLANVKTLLEALDAL